MSQKIETKKILVNNGQELIAKVREYKNSGGEWKLREKYNSYAVKPSKSKKSYGWGIIISNGKQTVDINSTKDNFSKDSPNDEVEARTELKLLFPESQSATSTDGLNKDGTRNSQWAKSTLDNYTLKSMEEGNGEIWLYRYLVAENSWHLKKILNQYVRDNETKIYQSVNPHFSGWVDIIDGQDGNMYLYVGEKKDSGGREIKIGITKSEFENCKRDESDSPNKSLEDHWSLFTIDRPRTPTEEKEYYCGIEGLKAHWKTIQTHWKETCCTMFEAIRNELDKKITFLENYEPNSEIKSSEIKATNEMIEKINQRLQDMEKNHPNWYNNYNKTCPDCEMRMCCHKEGQPCGKNRNQSPENRGLICLQEGNNSQLPTLSKLSQKNNLINDTEKSQLLSYFLENDISRITIDNGKLVIEYSNNKEKETLEIDNQELQQIQQVIQNHNQHSLSLAELQPKNISNPAIPSKNNTGIYVGLTISAFVLGGMFIYFLVQKKKK